MSRRRDNANVTAAATAGLLIVVAVLYLTATVTARQAVLFLVGVGAGIVLYRAEFGFTSSWREFLTEGRGAGIRAQMLMLALTCAIFFPVLGTGHAFGQAVRGSVSPVGVSVLAGAFLFGMGMQLGGGCASGTLYSAGGGNTRMVVTLLFFIVGSVIGTAHMPWWSSMPAFKPFSLVTAYGVVAGLAVSIAAFAGVAAATVAIERRKHGRLQTETRIGRRPDGNRRPWPLVAGAAGLAAVNIATLLISGRPWGVTSAFALWGAKASSALGADVARWPYWTAPAQAASLNAPVWADVSSVMDFGIILGALVAAAVGGRFAPTLRTSGRSMFAAIVGGLMLGYGARIAYGCNIGAYFSGIASGSLHGWVWFAAALAGNMAGTGLRPLFGLSRVERTTPSPRAATLRVANSRHHDAV